MNLNLNLNSFIRSNCPLIVVGVLTCHIAVVSPVAGVGCPGTLDDWNAFLMEFCTGFDCEIDVRSRCVHLCGPGNMYIGRNRHGDGKREISSRSLGEFMAIEVSYTNCSGCSLQRY